MSAGGGDLDESPCGQGEVVVGGDQRIGLQLSECDVLGLVDVGPVQLDG